MHFAVLVGVFVKSNPHSHWYLQSGPQQDLLVKRNLPLAVHLVLRDGRVDNMKDHSP